ncbi:hypothetical protein K474DRAFT_1663877 [Panus rudis PR-1116 ss-1]|nr:hypothetical protein K474DRAFT_1663877 [Panus rudis PR-1116 ss-1]
MVSRDYAGCTKLFLIRSQTVSRMYDERWHVHGQTPGAVNNRTKNTHLLLRRRDTRKNVCKYALLSEKHMQIRGFLSLEVHHAEAPNINCTFCAPTPGKRPKRTENKEEVVKQRVRLSSRFPGHTVRVRNHVDAAPGTPFFLLRNPTEAKQNTEPIRSFPSSLRFEGVGKSR